MHLWRKPGSWRSAFERILKWHYLKCPHDFVYSLGNNKRVFNIPLRDRTETINTISTFKNKFPGFSFSPKSSSSLISSSSLLKTTLLFKTQGPNLVNLQGFIVSLLSQSQEKCIGFWSCSSNSLGLKTARLHLVFLNPQELCSSVFTHCIIVKT